MAVLHRDRILELLDARELIIESTDVRVPFDPMTQILADTIDLHLGPEILCYKNGLACADTLAPAFDELFERVKIPSSGYILKPGHIIFGSAVELVCLTNGRYMGRFSNRGTFSRFGVSVTCGKLRFPAGDPGTPDLQIANHASVPVKIYPYMFIVQLQIETMDGTADEYNGVYPKSIGPVPPALSERDRSVKHLLRELMPPATEPDEAPAVKEILNAEITVQPAPPTALRIEMSPRVRALSTLLSGVLSTAVAGYIINMISQDSWSYWKYVSLGFAALAGITFLFIGVLLTLGAAER